MGSAGLRYVMRRQGTDTPRARDLFSSSSSTASFITALRPDRSMYSSACTRVTGIIDGGSQAAEAPAS